jgi:hypothetical protein
VAGKDNISEAASQKPAPKKRGRPPAYTPERMRWIKNLFPDITTVRGRQNRANSMRAFGVLADDPAFEWLVSSRQAVMEGTGRLRKTALAELRRIGDDDELREAAALVCEHKHRSRDAAAMIRRWRLGRDAAGSADGLHETLRRALDDYLATHAIGWGEVKGAVHALLMDVKDPARRIDRS